MIFPHRFRDTPNDVRDLRSLITGDDGEVGGVLNRALTGSTRLRRQQNFTVRTRLTRPESSSASPECIRAWLVELPPGDRGR